METFDILPWQIQKRILSFNIKYDLHKELIYIYFLRTNLKTRDRKVRNFFVDCISIAPVLKRDLDWYEWILQKVYKGETPWIFIYDEVDQEDLRPLKNWLKICSKRRFLDVKRYGFSLWSSLTRFLQLI